MKELTILIREGNNFRVSKFKVHDYVTCEDKDPVIIMCLHRALEASKKKGDEQMDKKIKALQKDTKKLAKKETSLLKEDKKHDKVIEKAKKMKKGKC